jgi:adenosine deaminase
VEYPYIDLHLHLDGSLPPATVLKLAKQQGIRLPAESIEGLRSFLMVAPDCGDLNEYLEKFELPLQLLQTGEALETAVFDLAEWLTAQEVGYAEIRFAPQLHGRKGMNQTQAVEAALRGVSRAEASEEIHTRLKLILCCMRGDANQADNLETVRVAAHFRNQGVWGVDLAGAEGLFPTENFREVFAFAREQQVPFTIHAGEAAGPESIWTALEFGAVRIGHGIAAAQDPELMKVLRDRHIVVETCPTSNLQTKAVQSLSEHPVRKFLEMGFAVTVNTDNMTVSGTSVKQEFELLEQKIGLSREEKEQLMGYAREVKYSQIGA